MSIPMGGGYVPATGRVDFGWIGQAWKLLTAQFGVWLGATLLCGVVSLLVWVLAALPTGVLATLQQTVQAVMAGRTPPNTQSGSFLQFAETHLLAIIVATVSSVLYAGLSLTALRQIRSEPISALGLFSALPRALPLLAIGALTAIAVTLLEGLFTWFLHLASLPLATADSLAGLLAFLPNLILSGLLMFAPLLVLDRGATVSEAILGSVNLLKGQWVIGILFYIVAFLISGLGTIACGLGALLTFPLFIISISVGYQSLTQPPVSVPQYPPYGAYPPQPGVWPPPPSGMGL